MLIATYPTSGAEPHRRHLIEALCELSTTRLRTGNRLETVPKTHYTGRIEVLAFYESFFEDSGVEWCRDWNQMNTIAEEQARKDGIGALDALHI